MGIKGDILHRPPVVLGGAGDQDGVEAHGAQALDGVRHRGGGGRAPAPWHRLLHLALLQVRLEALSTLNQKRVAEPTLISDKIEWVSRFSYLCSIKKDFLK